MFTFFFLSLAFQLWQQSYITSLISIYGTFSKMVWEFGEWQAPCLKLPHSPNGVPKLANFIAEIVWPGAQFRCTFGLYTICLSSLSSSTFQFLTIGCHSDTSEHIVDTDLFLRLIFVASPPNSSNTTNKFLFGCNHDLGRWYLWMINHPFRIELTWCRWYIHELPLYGPV